MFNRGYHLFGLHSWTSNPPETLVFLGISSTMLRGSKGFTFGRGLKCEATTMVSPCGTTMVISQPFVHSSLLLHLQSIINHADLSIWRCNNVTYHLLCLSIMCFFFSFFSFGSREFQLPTAIRPWVQPTASYLTVTGLTGDGEERPKGYQWWPSWL